MVTVKIEKPDFVSEDAWQMDGVQLKVDDQMPSREREILVRNANALGMREIRLTASGSSVYEDPGSIEILIDQYARARKAIREIIGPDGPMTPEQMVGFLDGLGIVERDTVSNEVVGANRLGRKNGSGSLSS